MKCNMSKMTCETIENEKGMVICRFPPTTSGQHLLDKYAQTHANYDAGAKSGSIPVTLEG